MLIFHEGLPGAGKSYAAVADHIIPALKDGRDVYTNIRGVDAVKVAEYLGIGARLIVPLLHVCDSRDKDELTAFFLGASPDSLVVWDEIQDYYPATRQPMAETMTAWVTQHRHSGIDILLLGQDRRDVHNIFRRRIERVIQFRKMNALGLNNRYVWSVHQAQGVDKYKEVSTGRGTYDPAVYACYQSVRAGTENLETYSDDRANVLKQRGLMAVPVAVLVGVFAAYWLWGVFFSTDKNIKDTESPKVHVAPASAPAPASPRANPVQSAQPVAVASGVQVFKPLPQAYERMESTKVRDLFTTYKARVEGMVRSNADPTRWFAYVVWYDESFRERERLSRRQLEELGSVVTVHDYGLTIVNGAKRYDVTPTLDPIAQPVSYRSPDAQASYGYAHQ